MSLQFDEYVLDTGTKELMRAGLPVHVEPQVFDLLTFLIRHRERVVTKDELIDAVWNGRIISEAALSSRILAARRAVGDTGNDQIYIKTIHKRGFRFVGAVQEQPCALRSQEQTGAAPAALPDGASIVDPGTPHGDVASVRPASARPSIAVLPFVNLSGDPEQEYFAYGATEDLIRLLARNRWLTVIGRHSTMIYKGRDVDARDVGEALGVSYIIEGSVRRSGDHVRISADLIGTADGATLWSELYDFDLTDVFAVQERIAQQIAAAIEPELATIEQQLAARKPPENLDAWDCYQRGLWHFWAFTRPGFAEAEHWYRRAIDIEPGLARAHAALAYVNVQRAFYDDPASRPVFLRNALDHSRRAVALDGRDCLGHCVLGRTQCLHRNYDEAAASLQEAIDLNPSFAQGYFAQGFNYTWGGRQSEAIALFELAARLSPRDPHLWTFYGARAMAHFSLLQFEAAEQFCRRAIRQANATHWPHAVLTSCLGQQGKIHEGRAAAAELLKRKPGYSVAAARLEYFFCSDSGYIERFVSGLQLSGIPG